VAALSGCCFLFFLQCFPLRFYGLRCFAVDESTQPLASGVKAGNDVA